MKKLWVVALIVLLAPVVIKAQVQSFKRGGEVIKVEKLWSSPVWSLVWSVLVDEQKRIFIGGGGFNPAPRLRISSDSGKTWTPDGGYDPYSDVYAFALIDSGYVLAGTDNGIYRSKDHGVSWQRVFRPWPDEPYRIVLTLLVAKDKSIFAGIDHAIFRSTDNGNRWVRGAATTAIWPYVWTMTQTPLNDVILAGCGSSGFGVNDASGVIRSTDDGQSWATSNAGLPLSSVSINGSISIRAMTSCPFGSSPNVYLVTEYDGAFYSDNEGQSWKSIPIPNRNGGAAFTSVSLGVFLGFVSRDKDGYTLYRSYGVEGWLGIPGIEGMVECIAQWSPSQILVGTASGLYLVSFSNPLPVHESPTLVSDFQLSQNYPNPFNPSTTIEFTLPERSFVKLSVSNIIGQEVGVLVNKEERGTGVHRVEWNARDLPSGIYFYRLDAKSTFGSLTSERIVQTKKMLLAK